MQNLLVYGAAAGFLIAVFPVYFSVYAYGNTETKYASANFCLFRYIRFLNVNTAEDGNRMQVNGKDTQFNISQFLKTAKIFLDHVCIFKIIQLSEYGVTSEANAYIALAQSAVTLPLYKYLECTGSRCKLRNYVILNTEHSELRYSAKAVCVINLLAAVKLIYIILKRGLNENKN
ncbi:MAG: hypothetical protein LUD19_03805 [Clostridia bacterium]|nr:hypothetical protein [Clostridia bacterium]